MLSGTVVIKNAAMEPEIVDLANILNRMGAKVIGAGSNIIKIQGVKTLKDVSYHIMPDRIEAGTFLLITAATRGKIKLNNVIPEHLNSVIAKLEEASFLCTVKGTSIITETIFENRFKYIQELKRMGAKIAQEGNTIIINGGKRIHGASLESTDLRGGAAMVLLALCSKETSRISKIEYIERGYSDFHLKLQKLGAKINLEMGDKI